MIKREDFDRVAEICEEVEKIGIECYGLNDLADLAYNEIEKKNVDIDRQDAESIARHCAALIEQQ